MTDFDDIKERVREATNIVDLIGQDRPVKGGPNEFKALCPFHDDRDPSMGINRQKGIFKCFACDAGGDVFEWRMRRFNEDFPTALRTLAVAAGIAMPEPRVHRPEVRVVKPQREPVKPEKFAPLDPTGAVFRYLTEKRLLPAELLTRYSVGQTAEGDAYAFAYKWTPPQARRPGPVFEFAKVVKLERQKGEDGKLKKVEWREPKGGRNILFGMLAVPEDATELVITEGEIDAITWAAYGVPAVSVPCGATSTAWVDVCFEWLQRFRKIHLSFDEDRAGRLKVVELVTRLGMERTDIVRLPERGEDADRYKDANECLQAGVPAAAMLAALASPEIIKPDRLKSIYDFEREIWEKFHPGGKELLGLTLPWGNRHGSSLPFRFRYGEVTVWTGFNKHGKSEVLNHVAIDLCWQGEKVLVCSLEVAAPETYRKLLRMAHGLRDVAPEDGRESFRNDVLRPLADKVWVYDHVGNAALPDVLNVMLYAYQRFGCRQFILDSLMRFEGLDGEGQDIWNAQREFMNQLLNFAAQYRVHIHLVAHSKKPNDRKGEAQIPRRYDIMGSSYISNLAFNVIVVWRNRAKQDALEEVWQACEDAWVRQYPQEGIPAFKRLMGSPPPKALPLRKLWDRMVAIAEGLPEDLRATFEERVPQHDAYFIVDAQRGGDGDTPARHLWFHADSLQFLEAHYLRVGDGDPRSKPFRYVGREVITAEQQEEAI